MVKSKKFRDEIFALIRDTLPGWVIEVELSELDLLHDLLVRRSIERRDSGKYDVSDDTARPNIALWTVVLGENLWSNVIWCTQLLIKLLGLVKDQGRAEIDNFDLVEFFVLLKEDIFWLQVPVHNMIGMAVIDAGEDLFHEQ